MSTRWSTLILVVGGATVVWLVAGGTAVEPLIELALVLLGGFLIVRAALLRTGRAQPSTWAGHTALGTGLVGIGLLVIGLEQRVDDLASGLWFLTVVAGTIALVIGVWLESRAARRQADSSSGSHSGSANP